MAEKFSLKDHLFNADTVGCLAGLLAAADPGFDAQAFQTKVLAPFPTLELKQRITHIAAVLAEFLPADFSAAADLIEAALPPPLDPTKTDDDFGQFFFAPLGEYVVAHGLEEHFARSMVVLQAVTQRFSMEYAIRPFLNRWPDQTLEILAEWARHPHYHVRRLVSEGTRPKLPWGMKIHVAPDRTMPFLDILHADPTRFVTRSVANHLNDITKINNTMALSAVSRWQAKGLQDPKEMAWIAKHALRGLVKAGDPAALGLLGYKTDVGVTASIQFEEDSVPIGETLAFTVDLTAAQDLPAIVDYRLDFARPGRKAGSKVFKLKTCDLPGGKAMSLTKRHPLKGDATTFTLHPGQHTVSVQVNGTIVAEADFTLTAAK